MFASWPEHDSWQCNSRSNNSRLKILRAENSRSQDPNAYSIESWAGVHRTHAQTMAERASGGAALYRAEVPLENGYVESLNGKMREQFFLNGELYYTLKEAQILTQRWRRYDNTVRPHSSLGGQLPAPESPAGELRTHQGRWYKNSRLVKHGMRISLHPTFRT
jgi:hypothetical protein